MVPLDGSIHFFSLTLKKPLTMIEKKSVHSGWNYESNSDWSWWVVSSLSARNCIEPSMRSANNKPRLCKATVDNQFFVYILRCRDHSFYVGRTTDIERRIAEHRDRMCSYTAKRLPIEVVFISECANEDEAYVREHQIKKWSRAKKEAFICQEWKTLKVLSKKLFNNP